MTVNSQKLFDIQERLEKLLTDKKCLNSKVIADSFDAFKGTIEKARSKNAADLGMALRKLEQSLKNEGAYKNVKSGFESIKTDVLQIVENSDHVKEKTKGTPKAGASSRRQSEVRHSNPRAVTVTLSHSYARQNAKFRSHAQTIQRPTIEPHEPPAVRSKRVSVVEVKGTSPKPSATEELLSLNKTISRLFTHLEIDKPSGNVHAPKPHHQRAKVHGRSSPVGRSRVHRDDPEVKDLIEKLQKFEDEFQRRRERQNDEILSLQTQLQQTKSQIVDQSKELERYKGTHSITNKAKGKHVGLIEEKYLVEKKDMETRINELEQNLKRKSDGAHQGNERNEKKLHEDLMQLKNEINGLGKLIEKRTAKDNSKAVVKYRPKYREDMNTYDLDDLLQRLEEVGTEIKALKDSNLDLLRSVEENSRWKVCFLETEHDVEQFYNDIVTNINIPDNSLSKHLKDGSTITSPRSKSGPLKIKLQKAKTLLINTSKKLSDIERNMQEKVKRTENTSTELLAITEEIDKCFHELDILSEASSLSKGQIRVFPHSQLTPVEKVKLMQLKVQEANSSVSQYINKNVQQLEGDFEALQKRVLNLDTDVTKSYTDDNIHGDTPTPTRQLSIVSEAHHGVSETCNALLRKLDVFQVGFLQMQSQNKEMVDELNSSKKSSEKVKRIREEVDQLGKVVGLHTRGEDHGPSNDIVTLLRNCRGTIENKFRNLDSSENAARTTQNELEKVKRDVDTLWAYTEDKEESTRPKSEKQYSPKEKLDDIRKKYSKLKGESTAIYLALKEKDDILTKTEKELRQQLTQLELEVIKREDELDQNQKEISKLREDYKRKNEQNVKEQTEMKERLKLAQETLEKEKSQYRTEVQKMRQEIEEMESQIDDIGKEKLELQRRLNKHVGSQIEGITLPADINDANRPTKLAERFTELYKNEWISTHEILKNQLLMGEKEAITFLLKTVQEVYQFCRSLASDHLIDVHNVLLLGNKSGSAAQAFRESVKKLTKEETKLIKTVRKSTAIHAVDTVHMLFLRGDGMSGVLKEQRQASNAYVYRCVELCWLMGVQDPPLHITWNIKTGDKFDTSAYEYYSNKGEFMEYLVWPQLHLFKDGHRLCKGVVQAI